MEYKNISYLTETYRQDKVQKEVLSRGRATAIRLHGKSVFIDIMDGTGKIQLVMPKENYKECPIKKGDIIETTGQIRTTGTGEISIFYQSHNVLSTSKKYEQEDTELKQLLIDREKLESIVRNILKEEKITEVSSKILNGFAGTSNINPYKTKGIDGEEYFLRFTMELELKKYVARTQLPVFEVGTIFRNMGKSNRRATEFKTVEVYMPYQTLDKGIAITKKIIETVAYEFNKEMDPITMETATNVIKNNCKDTISLSDNVRQSYNEIVRKLEKPHIITNQPSEWVSPLTKKNSYGLAIDAKFFYKGIGTIIQLCEEETDYDKIECSVKSQEKNLSETREDTKIDEYFLDAIKNGMPPTLGIHIGLDRLLMAFTDRTNINKVIPR